MKLFTKYCLVFLAFLTFHCTSVRAQIADYETGITVTLDNGWEIQLYGESLTELQEAAQRRKAMWDAILRQTKDKKKKPQTPPQVKGNKWFYVPPSQSLRIADKENGDPEFMYMKFTGNTEGDPQGAVVHFLIEYGLTKEQTEELQEKLREMVDNDGAKIAGSLPMMPLVGEDSGTFEIVSATSTSDVLASSFAKSRAPVGRNDKAAVATLLNKYGAELMEESLRNAAISDLSVKLNYTFPIRVMAAEGALKFNREKLEEIEKTYEKETTVKTSGIWWWKKQDLTVDETESFYRNAYDNEVITCDFTEGVGAPPEVVKEIRDAFFSYFLNTFTRPSESTQVDRSALANPDSTEFTARRQTYNISVTQTHTDSMRESRTMTLKHRITINWPHSFTANMQSWGGGRSLADFIQEVTFDDPLFMKRYINVSPDISISDIIGEEINSVDVSLRVKTKDGWYTFADQKPVFFRKDQLAAQQRSFALGSDIIADDYEYKTTISYAGGLTESSPWKKGSMTNVNIPSGLRRYDIKLLVDTEEMKNDDVVHATLQIRYLKLGKETTDKISIMTNSDAQDAIKTVFMDQGREGYATRVILVHKKMGRVVLPWQQASESEDFHYVSIPTALSGMTEDLVKSLLTPGAPTDDKRTVLTAAGKLTAVIASEAAGLFD